MTDFDNRDTWLSFRADWRLRYKVASETIRSTKRQLCDLHAARRLTTAEVERERIDLNIASLQSSLHYQRQTASWMMKELDDAKEIETELLAARGQVAA